jgi:flagellar biosynthetic protein FliQ
MAMLVAVKVGAPILLVTVAIGLAISLFQSVTQIQEVTLTFVPKLLGVGLVLLLAGRWMLDSLVDFTHQLFNALPGLLS